MDYGKDLIIVTYAPTPPSCVWDAAIFPTESNLTPQFYLIQFCLDPQFSNSSEHENELEGLGEYTLSTPKVPDLAGQGWGPRICISNKFPADANVARVAEGLIRSLT